MMTRNKKFALFFLAVLVACSAAISARAQATDAPIVIKSKPAPKVKHLKERFEVLHMMINAIQVRSLADERDIRTFLYSDQIRDRMQAMFNNGGYQYGDKVVIYYMPRSDVALNIKGKPSKPI
jgi:hypothetical protein